MDAEKIFRDRSRPFDATLEEEKIDRSNAPRSLHDTREVGMQTEKDPASSPPLCSVQRPRREREPLESAELMGTSAALTPSTLPPPHLGSSTGSTTSPPIARLRHEGSESKNVMPAVAAQKNGIAGRTKGGRDKPSHSSAGPFPRGGGKPAVSQHPVNGTEDEKEYEGTSFIPVRRALDEVSRQCQSRGLTHTSLWLAQLALDATEDVMEERIAAKVTTAKASQPGARLSLQFPPWPLETLFLDRVMSDESSLFDIHPSWELEYKKKYGKLYEKYAEEFAARMKRHHRVALALLQNQEYQRCHHNLSKLEKTLLQEEEEHKLNGSSPLPWERGLPSCLQFLRLYALFLDGEKVRHVNRTRNASAASPASGSAEASLDGLNSSRWRNPHLRELRLKLHDVLLQDPSDNADASPPPFTTTLPPSTEAHTDVSGVKPHPALELRHEVANFLRHRRDPYLLWLLGVVLREMNAPVHEFRSFFLASIIINPLFYSAWEDMSKAVMTQADFEENLRPLKFSQPRFMYDIFAAGIQTMMGTLNMAGDSAGGASSEKAEVGTPKGEGQNEAAMAAVEGGQSAGTISVRGNLWERLLGHFPQNTFLLSQLAEATYYIGKNSALALSLLSTVTEMDPYRLEHVALHSNLLYLKPDPFALCTLAQKVNRVNPFSAQANIVVGNYYCALQKHDRSIYHFRRALMIDPTVMTAWTLLGQAYLENKDIYSARDAFRCAVELDARDYRGWYNLGHSFELLGVYDRAVFYYNKAAQLRPFDSRMWRALASCYFRTKRDSFALECLKRVEACEEPPFLAGVDLWSLGGPPTSEICEALLDGQPPISREYLTALQDLAEFYLTRGEGVGPYLEDTLHGFQCFLKAAMYYRKLFLAYGGPQSSIAMQLPIHVVDVLVRSSVLLRHLHIGIKERNMTEGKELMTKAGALLGRKHPFSEEDIHGVLDCADAWFKLCTEAKTVFLEGSEGPKAGVSTGAEGQLCELEQEGRLSRDALGDPLATRPLPTRSSGVNIRPSQGPPLGFQPPLLTTASNPAHSSSSNLLTKRIEELQSKVCQFYNI